MSTETKNPFRDVLGARPPCLAGRGDELRDFLAASAAPLGHTRNFCITGLHGLGKTVLLQEYGNAVRKMRGIVVAQAVFTGRVQEELAFLEVFLDTLAAAGEKLALTLPAPDSKRRALEGAFCEALLALGAQALARGRRVVLLLDDFHNLRDTPKEKQFPLSSLIRAFDAAQSQGLPVNLVVAGLPSINANLHASRGVKEGFFHRQPLTSLSAALATRAFTEPLRQTKITYNAEVPARVYEATQGHPGFVQKYGRVLWDFAEETHHISNGLFRKTQPYIMRDIEQDFYAVRWETTAPRERRTLRDASRLGGEDFTVHALITSLHSEGALPAAHKKYKSLHRSLSRLVEAGLLYKRPVWGEYAYTLPLFGDFLRRQDKSAPRA